ncbi:unnamed protein product [Cylicocyclus nassatus]|uniref:Crossover junction endonuclease MUS81 n=1 Tax=Cylicocyclus nassatus TaxID=53992 RepID=A0AA36GJR5_CYLNA|nr:unnamed protein product [Cylicocyclus nassatus]
MVEKRVKIRVEHRQKLFYERLLRAWKEKMEDTKFKYGIYKAYTHLKHYPLEVCTITDLKQIHGIGEHLAVRCHAAWEAAVAAHSEELDLKTIKKLTDEELMDYLYNGRKRKNTAAVVTSGERTSPAKAKKRKKQSKPDNVEQPTDVLLPSESNVQSTSENNAEFVSPPESPEAAKEDIHYITCQPTEHAEVVLIADSREDHGGTRRNTVVDCLTASSYRVEMRSLSVGDYLWVLRKIDGTEIVLDWVVERKTWDDLRQSIRMGRYEEQKQRLRHAPMKNVVYLVEGTFTPDYAACEQALATTMIRHGFMIQRTKSPKDTAQFLCRLTDHLKETMLTRQMTGISYESLQILSKKARADTVKDTWIRQLMVCPGMSAERAQKVAYRFPSMAAMIQQYSQTNDADSNSLLSSTVPEINRALSAQMRKFFSSVTPDTSTT